jgi:putative aldouronate transport system substrate-binding protein
MLVSAITASMLAACGGNEETTSDEDQTDPSSGEETTSNEPVEIKMALNFDGTDVPQPENDIELAIEEYTNSKLDITHMVSANYCERLPVLIASGDLPDVLASCGAPKQPYLISAMKDGVFWEVGQYLDQFPNLSSMSEVVYDNVEVEGELYGLPRYRPLSRFVQVYRQDWLDNLGLEAPTNHEEYVEVLRAFTNDDPNQSGADDTRGITSVALPGDFGFDFGILFGAPHEWKVEDGKFIAEHETEEYFEGLKYSRQLYEEGLVNADIVAPDRETRDADFENGISGFFNASTNNVLSIESRLKGNFPDAELGVINALEGPTGEKRLESQFGSNGIMMFPKATVETEEELLQLLTFFDQLSEPEMADLLQWGVEGEHYELVDGKATYLDYDKYMKDVGFGYKFPLTTAPLEPVATSGDLSELGQRVAEIEIENDDLVVVDPAMSLVSEVYNNLGADIEQLINDAKYKFVTGTIDEAGWHEAVQNWRDRGGDEIRADFERLYAEDQQ